MLRIVRAGVLLGLVTVPCLAGCDGGGEGCSPAAITLCAGDGIYWFDSCGVRGDLVVPCACGCEADGLACRSACPCVPDCAGRECGDDGCGDPCGACEEGEACDAQGRCGCTDGVRRCAGAVVEACSAGAWQVVVDCASADQVCAAGTCVPCLVGDTRCALEVVETCGAFGWEPLEDCATSGLHCFGGACATCPPGGSRCAGTWIESCVADAWVPVQDCALDGQVCEWGACTPCRNESFRCQGDVWEMCDRGTWVQVLDCAAQGQICVDQECHDPCTPECAGRECGPDPACGFSCGQCAAPAECAESVGRCSAGPWPTGSRFDPRCDAQNVAVFFEEGPGTFERAAMRIRCALQGSDLHGAPISAAGVEFQAEEGCTLERLLEAGNPDLVVSLRPDCDPRDVEPLAGEPYLLDNGMIRNPRDGLLTLIFWAEGEEGFLDANGNGLYDLGENFAGFDLPEPFVDADDDREHDAGSEAFVDANGNGVWDPANGRWDADTVIWAATHVMFTGAPAGTSIAWEPAELSVPNCGAQDLELYLVDLNLNPLAVNGPGDTVSMFPCAAVEVSEIVRAASLGVDFNPDGTVRAASFLEDRRHPVQASDADCEQPNGAGPEACQVTVYVGLTPAPAFDTYQPGMFGFEIRGLDGTAD